MKDQVANYYGLIERLALTQETVTTDDMRLFDKDFGLDVERDFRYVGTALRTAQREGIIEWTPNRVRSENKRGHLKSVRIWRSKIVGDS